MVKGLNIHTAWNSRLGFVRISCTDLEICRVLKALMTFAEQKWHLTKPLETLVEATIHILLRDLSQRSMVLISGLLVQRPLLQRLRQSRRTRH